jgi:cell division septation protein DedD
MASKSQKNGGSKKGRIYELTRKEMLLWIGVGFLALMWMFTLGVIVGRGLSPVRFDVEKLTKELIAMKEAALKSAASVKKPSMDLTGEKRHLGFYDVLTDKKEEARLKTVAKKQKPAVKTKPSTVDRKKEKTESAVQRKPSLAKKDTEASPSKAEAPGAKNMPFTLQVASLRDLSKAEKMVSLLKTKGYKAYAVTAQVSGKGTYHRVRVGHFKDRGDARTTALRLRTEKYEPIVIRK